MESYSSSEGENDTQDDAIQPVDDASLEKVKARLKWLAHIQKV